MKSSAAKAPAHTKPDTKTSGHRKSFSLSAIPVFFALGSGSSTTNGGGSGSASSSSTSASASAAPPAPAATPPLLPSPPPPPAGGGSGGGVAESAQPAAGTARTGRTAVPNSLRDFFRLLRLKSSFASSTTSTTTNSSSSSSSSSSTSRPTRTGAAPSNRRSSSPLSAAATTTRTASTGLAATATSKLRRSQTLAPTDSTSTDANGSGVDDDLLDELEDVTTLNDVQPPPTTIKRISFEEMLLPQFTHKYVVQEMLGEGAYGFVCSAQDIRSGAMMAVKFIEKNKLRPVAWLLDNTYGRIPCEVKILKSLNHPNIIKFFDYFEDADYCYLVTELGGSPWDAKTLNPTTSPGIMRKSKSNSLGKYTGSRTGIAIKRRTSGDLFEFVDQFTFIEFRTVKTIFRQVVSAVQYMHHNGFVHKDIKDENILVDVNYCVKLCDFGSAAPIPDSPAKYFRIFTGTWNYAPPEILCGSAYRGPECDIWACGSLLFILLFNQNPFQTPEETTSKPLVTPLPVSPACKHLLLGMLRKDLKKRMTIDEVVSDPWLNSDED